MRRMCQLPVGGKDRAADYWVSPVAPSSELSLIRSLRRVGQRGTFSHVTSSRDREQFRVAEASQFASFY